MLNRTTAFESIHIPFKAKFAHNSKTRESTETIVVLIKNELGQTGIGESCPRDYVTGETISSVQEFIQKTLVAFNKIQNLSELRHLQKLLKEEIDKNPTAWCALEMAMLDLLAQEQRVSVESMLELGVNSGKSSYTAVLGIDHFSKLLIKCIIYKCLGFTDFKIKLSGDSARDLLALKIVSFFSNKIRVDGNNIFSSATEAIEFLKPLRKYIWAIEEPVKVQSYSEMFVIAQTLKLKIILDESFLNIETLEKISGKEEFFIPNIRISKQGGIIRSIETIKKLELLGFQWILGSHVGEMSLLTRASLLLSGNFEKQLIAKEGGFSTHLLSYDPMTPNLILGFGAQIKNRKSLGNTGWGIDFLKRNEE